MRRRSLASYYSVVFMLPLALLLFLLGAQAAAQEQHNLIQRPVPAVVGHEAPARYFDIAVSQVLPPFIPALNLNLPGESRPQLSTYTS